MSGRAACEQLDLLLPPCEFELSDGGLARVTNALVDLRCAGEHCGQAFTMLLGREQPHVVSIGERRSCFGDIGIESQPINSSYPALARSVALTGDRGGFSESAWRDRDALPLVFVSALAWKRRERAVSWHF